MNDTVLTTRGPTERYGEHTAVDEVTLRFERGRVYGLIGRNGAGKTALMRLIKGLSIPASGTIELFGSGTGHPRQQDLARIGTLIESPTLHGAMNARQNMHLHRLLRGVPDPAIEEKLLEVVGLAGTGRKKVRDFSLGMRQRLGIALALITDPELLILDEPVNVLDPQGVVEVRRLVRTLAEERGLTVLISSHNLPELFQTATDYLIVEAGRLHLSLTLAELEARTQQFLEIAARDTDELVAALAQIAPSADVRVMPDGTVRMPGLGERSEEILRELVGRGIWPTRLASKGESLESFFLSVVGGEGS